MGAAAAVAALFFGLAGSSAQNGHGPETLPTVVLAEEWTEYRERFIDASGRVIDHEKRGSSHSEGQGYGLLLSVMADDRATFDRVLAFTYQQLAIRDDHLFSWIYDPRQNPRVYDRNNASDGDILIAFALINAAMKWNEPYFLQLAEPIVEDIGRLLVTREDGFWILRPAVYGFGPGEHQSGPVVNLSYYVYGAFPLFAVVNQQYPWLELWDSGLRLTAAAAIGARRLVPDWVTLQRERFLAPADGFRARSSYDAVRIPLYMALAGKVPAQHFAPFDRGWRGGGAAPVPIDYDFDADAPIARMSDAGYRAIGALTACVSRGNRIPADLQRYRNGTYFSSTLHLLTLAAVRWQYPACIEALATLGEPRRRVG